MNNVHMRLQNIPNETQCMAATVLAYVLKQFLYTHSCALESDEPTYITSCFLFAFLIFDMCGKF